MQKIPFDDPRIPLAAERTLLAWVRTGLALMGLGFVVARFGLFLHEISATRNPPMPDDRSSVWIGAGMVALGAGLNLFAAIRHGRLLRQLGQGGVYRQSPWSAGVVVTLVVAALGAALAAYLLR